MNDSEIWACAAKVRAEHGHDGAVFAAKRAAELYKAGNFAGFDAWLRILVCVAHFVNWEPKDNTLH